MFIAIAIEQTRQTGLFTTQLLVQLFRRGAPAGFSLQCGNLLLHLDHVRMFGGEVPDRAGVLGPKRLEPFARIKNALPARGNDGGMRFERRKFPFQVRFPFFQRSDFTVNILEFAFGLTEHRHVE